MIECRCKIEEEVKARQSEIKKNIQETNSERKETGFRSMFGNRRKKQIFNQNRMKKQEF